MIDTKHIGRQLPSTTFEVEKGRLRFFAKATGETRPQYIDEAAAKAAGYRSLPVPPTFLMGADLDAGIMFTLLDELGVPIGNILHGEQSFTYHAQVCAGDVLKVDSRIADIYHKKGGALEFIVKDSVITDQNGVKVMEARSVIVARNPKGEDGMSVPTFDQVKVGDELPALKLPRIADHALALFAGASGDHNPVHIDLDFAKAAGMPDVFAHGMLSMAYLGRFLTNWAPQTQLRHYAVRFSAITPIGAKLTCGGKVVEKLERNGEQVVKLGIGVVDDKGELKLSGDALVALK